MKLKTEVKSRGGMCQKKVRVFTEIHYVIAFAT